MLPPVLEVYIVHHQADSDGAEVARQVFEHFHGTSFSGLVGGAVEVFVRSQPFGGIETPRPIPFPGSGPTSGVLPAEFIAVVPAVGRHLARAVQQPGPWADYLRQIVVARARDERHVGVFPVAIGSVDHGSRINQLLGPLQYIAAPSGLAKTAEGAAQLRGRDLAQAIAQMILGAASRLQVFISHTRHHGADEGQTRVHEFVSMVREVIEDTRLRHFFDATDLQPGRDWSEDLIKHASTSALLALRTDLYPTRTWCQREMVTAKRAGMPIVVLDALGHGEERGSFLMDHLPRIPVRGEDGGWRRADVYRGLTLLVDEALKRAIWAEQKRLGQGRPGLEVSWWAPHAPEPVTVAHWVKGQQLAGVDLLGDGTILILHPDPPLGKDEFDSISEMIRLMGHRGELDILTPRAFAARGA